MLKIRTIVLLLIAVVFSFNSFGFIFYFMIEREYVKEKVWEEISGMKEKKEIETISISLTDIEKGQIIQRISKKEIRYEGRMYDIVKEEKHINKIIFYCVHDEKEDKLEKEYSKNVQKNLNHKSATNARLNFNQQIQFAEMGKSLAIISPVRRTTYSVFTKNNYHLNEHKVLTPPPKLIFS